MGEKYWLELLEVMAALQSANYQCRALVIAAKGKHFCSGLDLKMNLKALMMGEAPDAGRRAVRFRAKLKIMQDSFTALELAPFPIIAAVHGACIGGGIDLISAVDIRLCSNATTFSVKEVDIGLAADLGTLQRFPKIVGNSSFVRDVVYTGRAFAAAEAHRVGFVSEVIEGGPEAVLTRAVQLAKAIGKKSPMAISTSKISLVHSRDHSVQEGLDYISALNGAAVQSKDLLSPPPFAKL